jgi:hypothetical protein
VGLTGFGSPDLGLETRQHVQSPLVGQLSNFSEFYYQLSVDGLANGSDAFGG